MELYLVLILFLVSFSWSMGSYLVKEGLYYTSAYSSLFMKSATFFLVSMALLLYFKLSNKKINFRKSKKGFKYLTIAVILTFFIGSISYLFLIQELEKLSMVVFIKSVATLFLVSVFSYMFLDERINKKQIQGIIIGLIGIGIIVFNSNLYEKKN